MFVDALRKFAVEPNVTPMTRVPATLLPAGDRSLQNARRVGDGAVVLADGSLVAVLGPSTEPLDVAWGLFKASNLREVAKALALTAAASGPQALCVAALALSPGSWTVVVARVGQFGKAVLMRTTDVELTRAGPASAPCQMCVGSGYVSGDRLLLFAHSRSDDDAFDASGASVTLVLGGDVSQSPLVAHSDTFLAWVTKRALESRPAQRLLSSSAPCADLVLRANVPCVLSVIATATQVIVECQLLAGARFKCTVSADGLQLTVHMSFDEVDKVRDSDSSRWGEGEVATQVERTVTLPPELRVDGSTKSMVYDRDDTVTVRFDRLH